jgi:hypothetical protein
MTTARPQVTQVLRGDTRYRHGLPNLDIAAMLNAAKGR